jgi:hypothetical protein
MTGNFVRMMLRSIAVWLLIICSEVVNGTIRVLMILPMIGNPRAKQVSFLTALILISGITFFLIKWVRPAGFVQTITIGVVWASLTLGFEIAIGRFVAGATWEAIGADYDAARGGLMLFGLAYVLMVPSIAFRLRRQSF